MKESACTSCRFWSVAEAARQGARGRLGGGCQAVGVERVGAARLVDERAVHEAPQELLAKALAGRAAKATGAKTPSRRKST